MATSSSFPFIVLILDSSFLSLSLAGRCPLKRSRDQKHCIRFPISGCRSPTSDFRFLPSVAPPSAVRCFWSLPHRGNLRRRRRHHRATGPGRHPRRRALRCIRPRAVAVRRVLRFGCLRSDNRAARPYRPVWRTLRCIRYLRIGARVMTLMRIMLMSTAVRRWRLRRAGRLRWTRLLRDQRARRSERTHY